MNEQQNNYQYQPDQQYQPYDMPAEPSKSEGIKAMIFGILSIYIGWFTVVPFVGFIFAYLAKKWSLPIVENYPTSTAAKFAKIGKITGTIGFWVSLAATILIALAVLIYVAYVVLIVFLYGMLLQGL